jgi:hypothetical protein
MKNAKKMKGAFDKEFGKGTIPSVPKLKAFVEANLKKDHSY